MNKKLVPLLIIAGVVFLGIAIFYWVTAASNLPHWFPGYEVGNSRVHFKHGLAALLLALGCGVWAWFSSGKKDQKPTSTQSTPTE